MPRPLNLGELPRPARRRPWTAIAASAGVHLLVLLFGWIEGRIPDVPRRAPQLIVLVPPGADRTTVEIPFATSARPTARQRGRSPTPGLERERARSARRPAVPPPGAVAPEAEVRQPEDTGGAPPPRRPPLIGRIGPGLADGRLWVRPLPLPPKELAQRLERSHVELVDSAVTAIVQGYLDSIALDPAAREVGLPSWTTEVAGKKFGLDSRNIYIAGLKIPAAVLALLPIPQGNIDQNRAYNHLMELRSDLQQAARRAENLDEFKAMIRDMRERKEREREFERNQRTAPPPDDPPLP
ncbi:MAG TPA: hypothetical protein VMN37_03880 [Gemmatimonadales bacterium]|nr:hypothetical protein [Gemmatimonadales bacterium]